MAKNKRQIVRKEDELIDNAKALSKEMLGQIVSYQGVFSKIREMADDDELDPATRLKALSIFVNEYQFLRGHEIKAPKQEDVDLSDFTDEELDEMLKEADEKTGKVIEAEITNDDA